MRTGWRRPVKKQAAASLVKLEIRPNSCDENHPKMRSPEKLDIWFTIEDENQVQVKLSSLMLECQEVGLCH